MNKTRLIIARHGNTFAPGDTVTRVGVTDLPLVATGLAQGRALGQYLRKQQYVPDVIFTSKLRRTIETAEQVQQQLALQLPITPLEIFNEIDYGPDENKPEAEVIARVSEKALAAWENSATVPEGWHVNPAAIIATWYRFAKELEDYYSNKTILVITSNGIARFAPHLTGDFISFARTHPIKLATGALAVFEKSAMDSYWQCLSWNIMP